MNNNTKLYHTRKTFPFPFYDYFYSSHIYTTREELKAIWNLKLSKDFSFSHRIVSRKILNTFCDFMRYQKSTLVT